MTPRVAVTGASGFCGRHVVRALKEWGMSVVSVGRTAPDGLHHRHWDAAGPLAPNLAGIDAVIHLAAAVGDSGHFAEFQAVNIDGTRRLLALRMTCQSCMCRLRVSTAPTFPGRTSRRRTRSVAMATRTR